MALSKLAYKLFEKTHFRSVPLGEYEVQAYYFDENNESHWFCVDDLEVYPFEPYGARHKIILRLKKRKGD